MQTSAARAHGGTPGISGWARWHSQHCCTNLGACMRGMRAVAASHAALQAVHGMAGQGRALMKQQALLQALTRGMSSRSQPQRASSSPTCRAVGTKSVSWNEVRQLEQSPSGKHLAASCRSMAAQACTPPGTQASTTAPLAHAPSDAEAS